MNRTLLVSSFGVLVTALRTRMRSIECAQFRAVVAPEDAMASAKKLASGLVFSVVLFAVAMAVNGSARAQGKPDRITSWDDFNIQLAEDPQISPDGKEIVYVREFADVMTDQRYTNLWIVSADGSRQRALTTGNRHDGSVRWSPDGTRIAFIGESNGKPQIFVRWMDSGQTARITNLSEAPGGINWSPDGKMISFTSLVLGKGPHIGDVPSPPEGAKWASPAKVYGD